jgi:hypothetical protein
LRELDLILSCRQPESIGNRAEPSFRTDGNSQFWLDSQIIAK